MTSDTRSMSVQMGGPLAALILRLSGTTFNCICDTPIRVTETCFDGYPHDGGVADAAGRKWWIWVHCDKCGFDTSAWKIPHRVVA
jgi:hypothetical protein